MISDKQRREVAKRLRNLADSPEEIGIPEHKVISVLGISGGFYDDCCKNEDVAALADLIDRPTGHDVSDFDHEAFKCSLCGYRVLTRSGDSCDAVVVSPDGLVSEYCYCPNCGKEVVE